MCSNENIYFANFVRFAFVKRETKTILSTNNSRQSNPLACAVMHVNETRMVTVNLLRKQLSYLLKFPSQETTLILANYCAHLLSSVLITMTKTVIHLTFNCSKCPHNLSLYSLLTLTFSRRISSSGTLACLENKYYSHKLRKEDTHTMPVLCVVRQNVGLCALLQ